MSARDYITMYNLSSKLSRLDPGKVMRVSFVLPDGSVHGCLFSRDYVSYTYTSEWQTVRFDRFIPMGVDRLKLYYDWDPMEFVFRAERMQVLTEVA